MSLWKISLSQNSNEIISGFLPWNFLQLPGDLVSNIINMEAYKKPQGSYKKFQGRNPYKIFIAILVKTMTP